MKLSKKDMRVCFLTIHGDVCKPYPRMGEREFQMQRILLQRARKRFEYGDFKIKLPKKCHHPKNVREELP